MMERYLWHINEYLVKTYLAQLPYYRNLSEAERPVLVDYLKSLFFGMTMHWLENGLDAGVQTRLQQLFTIRQHAFFQQMALVRENEK